ncbi:Uncharacterised protein [Mycobacteroides abscessus subsp. abscessus]|nr:Uncharacterised protein [Mycobacteroides abscessus subsp. abscessus]
MNLRNCVQHLFRKAFQAVYHLKEDVALLESEQQRCINWNVCDFLFAKYHPVFKYRQKTFFFRYVGNAIVLSHLDVNRIGEAGFYFSPADFRQLFQSTLNCPLINLPNICFLRKAAYGNQFFCRVCLISADADLFYTA